jgi:serine O-acetyltransferase
MGQSMSFDGRISVETDVFDNKTSSSLAYYVAKQLDFTFPSEVLEVDAEKILQILTLTIERLRQILKNVICYDSNIFYTFNALQYSTFLYLLASEQSKSGSDITIADRIFYLNKMLNSIELFYKVELPEIFFISHGIGTVLGNAKYGNRFVFFQNVTVGRVNESRPTIGDGVILYPGVIVSGNTFIGNNCVISAGIKLHNELIPHNTVVKEKDGQIVFIENKCNFIDYYLKREEL